MNTVPQIKHMAFALTEARQNGRDFFFNTGGRSIQHRRIHVALQGDFVSHATARIGNIGGPVEAQRITAGCSQGFEPLTAAFGKQGFSPAYPTGRAAPTDRHTSSS